MCVAEIVSAVEEQQTNYLSQSSSQRRDWSGRLAVVALNDASTRTGFRPL